MTQTMIEAETKLVQTLDLAIQDALETHHVDLIAAVMQAAASVKRIRAEAVPAADDSHQPCEPDVEMGGCPTIGAMGMHSNGYADGDPCRWCGAVSLAMTEYLNPQCASADATPQAEPNPKRFPESRRGV